MTGQYYTRATKLNGLAQIGADRGADLPKLLASVGIDPAALKQPEAMIDYGAFCLLLQKCAIAWDLPDIGIRMVRYQAIDFLGPVALVTRMETTVRNAVKAIIANLILHANATFAALEEEGDTATLIMNRRADALDSRENAELIMAQGKLVLDTIALGPVHLIEVRLQHEKGASATSLGRHFGCPIHYQADSYALSFDRALLDRPIGKSDMAYHALIKRYLADAHAEMEGGVAERARGEIARQMELGQCTVANVAHALQMTPRSLQRSLANEGTSFRELMDEWRRDRALLLVTNTRLPLSQVSESLGYAEQSVFTQAFKRWYGDTPQSCRIGHLQAAARPRLGPGKAPEPG